MKAGVVPVSQVDATVRRLFTAKFLLGLLDDPFADPDAAARISGAASHRPLALEAARQSIILLENDNTTLPLDATKLSRVAVIGPHAAELMLGNYSGTPREGVTILEGIRKRLPAGATAEYAEGARITEDSTFTTDPQPHMGGTRSHQRSGGNTVVMTRAVVNLPRFAAAVDLARRSEVAIVVVGDNEQTSREGFAETHLVDRPAIDLPGQQEALVRAVAATGTPTVLVLIHGRPASIPDLVREVPAILDGWYLGQETGTAIADVLFGDVNPGGKLPVTVARELGQLPVFYNYKPSARRGYLSASTAPRFPFGYGLSYTTFSYANVRLSSPRSAPDGCTTVSVDVTNGGARAGEEAVQLYLRDVTSGATRPVKELRGFSRRLLQPGETRTVQFAIGRAKLEYHDPDMRRVVESGAFDVMVGGNSVDVQQVLLDVRPREAQPR